MNPYATDIVGDGIDQNCDDLDGTDVDQDGFASTSSGGNDCDDFDPFTYPGAAVNEVPTYPDYEDCWRDADGDGWGAESPGGTVTAGLDCDDTNSGIYPGAVTEAQWGTDCLIDADGDGFGDRFAAAPYDRGSDCNDAEPAHHPGASDPINDGIDANCSVDMAAWALDVDITPGAPTDTAAGLLHVAYTRDPYDSGDTYCSRTFSLNGTAISDQLVLPVDCPDCNALLAMDFATAIETTDPLDPFGCTLANALPDPASHGLALAEPFLPQLGLIDEQTCIANGISVGGYNVVDIVDLLAPEYELTHLGMSDATLLTGSPESGTHEPSAWVTVEPGMNPYNGMVMSGPYTVFGLYAFPLAE